MSGTLREQRDAALRFVNSEGLSVEHWRREFMLVFGFKKTPDEKRIIDPCATCDIQQALSGAVILVSRNEKERDDFFAAAQDIADREGLLVQMDAIGSREIALLAAPAVLRRLTGHDLKSSP